MSRTNKAKRQAVPKRTSWKKLRQEELNEQIKEKAYELYESRGRANGDEWSDWFEAEKNIKSDK